MNSSWKAILSWFFLKRGVFCLVLVTCFLLLTAHGGRGDGVDSLIQQWGQPDKRMINSNGNTIYVYIQHYPMTDQPTSPSIGVNVSGGRPVITTPMNPTWNRSSNQLTCVTLFEVNPQGRIVRSERQGSGCHFTPSIETWR